MDSRSRRSGSGGSTLEFPGRGLYLRFRKLQMERFGLMIGTVRRGVAWTTENVQKLKDLWGQKLSASQVAKEIPGATRNAIIGKVHRLGLPAKTKATSPTPNRVRKVPQRRIPVVKPIVVKPPVAVPPTGSVEFLKLTPFNCRSVEGYSLQDGRNLPYYCSNRKTEEESFCSYHRAIFYRGRDEYR